MYFFFFSSRRRHTRYWRDWSSDVCSSDLRDRARDERVLARDDRPGLLDGADDRAPHRPRAVRVGGPRRGDDDARGGHRDRRRDRESVVEGKRGELGGWRIIKKKKDQY